MHRLQIVPDEGFCFARYTRQLSRACSTPCQQYHRKNAADARRASFAIAMGGGAVATLCLGLVPHGALAIAAACQFAVGLFIGGYHYQSNLNAAMVEAAEADSAHGGRSTMGSHFALLALTNKLGYALAIGICYPLLGALGFKGTHVTAGSNGSLLMAVGLGGAALLLTLGGMAFPRAGK